MRVGLIGYGVGGSIFHAPFILRTPGLQLAVVATSREVPIPGVRVVARPDDVITDPSIDLVVVTTPTATHFEIARAALLRDKHVVVDKPITTSVRQANALIQLAEERGRTLSVYQNRRWDGDFLTVSRLLANDELGLVKHYEAHYDRFRTKLRGVWREQPGEGSGILLDLGAHLVDQCLMMFGRPDAISADVRTQRDGAQAVDYFHLVLDYVCMVAVLHATMLAPRPGPHFTLHGEKGSFFKYGMDPQEDALRAGKMPGDPGWGEDAPENYGELYLADGAQRTIPTLKGCYENYYARLKTALFTGGDPPVGARGSRDGLVVLEGAIRSSRERRWVDLVFED